MEELKPLVIGDLVVKKPIIQGGMGVGISLHRLAGAVAKAGGMGIISAAHFGELLREALAGAGYEVKEIIESPAEGLLKYHHGK